jgi:hypothetical protein
VLGACVGESKVAKQVALGAEQKLRQEQQDAFQRNLFEASLGRKYANAVMEDLDTYMEQLYEEDIGTKVTALGMIAQLFRKATSLNVLLAKNGLVQLLARTLRESGKKSMDLAINVVSAFFSLSYFSCFHGVIMDNQVGAMTLDLVSLEIQRTALRIRETGISPADIAQKVCYQWHALPLQPIFLEPQLLPPRDLHRYGFHKLLAHRYDYADHYQTQHSLQSVI